MGRSGDKASRSRKKEDSPTRSPRTKTRSSRSKTRSSRSKSRRADRRSIYERYVEGDSEDDSEDDSEEERCNDRAVVLRKLELEIASLKAELKEICRQGGKDLAEQMRNLRIQQQQAGPPPPPSYSSGPLTAAPHFNSASYQYPDGEFESTCHYRRFNRFLNRKGLVKHLNWNNRSRTPFISVFDNREDAMDRAQMHLNWNHRNVRVCKINTQPLQLERVRCRQGMPVWATNPSLMSCFFFSTQEARRYLDLPYHLGQRSEWFAVNWIPAEMVSVDTFWDSCGQMHTRPVGITGGWYGDQSVEYSRPAPEEVHWW